MKPFVCAALLTAALATLAPAHAGDNMKLTNSQASVLVTASSVTLVVSGPVFLSAAGVNKVLDASEHAKQSRAERKAKRISAGPLPDMTVKSIDTTADGGRQVALEDPSNAENTATLRWPQREDNPAANFKLGERVAFTPSAQGAGWMLRAEDGAVLAFVPTAEAASDSHSALL